MGKAKTSTSYSLAMIEARYKLESEDESTVSGYIMNDHQGDSIVINIFPIGNWSGYYSCGLDMEIGEVGFCDLIDLNKNGIRYLLPALRDEHDWVRVITLWECRHWVNTDSYGSEMDWSSEYELLGKIKMNDNLRELVE